MTDYDRRAALVLALLAHAEKSGASNPCITRRKLKEYLDVDDGKLNIMMHQLGPNYLSWIGDEAGDMRCSIHVSECLGFKDQLNQETAQKARHGQSLRISILLVVFGALLGIELTLLFLR